MALKQLWILTKNPSAFLGEIKRAGAIFLGEYSPEAIGVYSKSAPCQRAALNRRF
ncbi:MAG: histidinol dehydrogenase [Helicobacteraceae bacterium]|nr:histidinol dehydrogenase [Helicobacteraceae bacterium]